MSLGGRSSPRSWTRAVAAAGLLIAGMGFAEKPMVPAEVTGVVNLNTATEKELSVLPGIGSKMAKRIVEHRAKAPFAATRDLAKVKGVGGRTVERLKAHLAVSGPTTLIVKR